MKKIVKGNDFTLRIPVMKMVEGQLKAFPLPACTDVVVQVCNQFKRIPLAFEIDVKEDNVLLARVEGDKMSLGTYAIEVKGKIFGNDWRSNEYPQFAIVSNNADADTEFGETDEGDNSVEMDTAMIILPPSVELSDLIDKANEAVKNSETTNSTLESKENARKEAEELRVTAERGRVSEEKKRAANETQRKEAESVRVSAENERVKTEQARTEEEKTRQANELTRKDNERGRDNAELERAKAEKMRVEADEKRTSDTNKAIKAAETATTGAETCNVTMQGSTISVTNRNGETKSVDVINTDEEVTVTIASSVDSIKVAGIKINVFLNNGKTPQTYTTDTEGKATFTVARGNYYQVTFPEYGNAQPIAPQGYTAVLGSRNINVEYLPYDEDTSEKVIVTVTKYTENVGTAWEGVPVNITYDNNTTELITDANGQVTCYVPLGKEYTIKVDDRDGYNVSFNRNERAYKAELPQRLVKYNMYQFRAGVFILDTNRNEYYLEDWIAAGRNADDAVAIKIADATLISHQGAFCIKTADMKNTAKKQELSWCTRNVLFNSIASIGNNVNDENFYSGNTSSRLVRQEAQERSLSVPAFDYAYSTTLTLGGEELRGFIMSAGQELVHVANLEPIKEILAALFGADTADAYVAYIKNSLRWTSTQHLSAYGWSCTSELSYNIKDNKNVVLPVYPC